MVHSSRRGCFSFSISLTWLRYQIGVRLFFAIFNDSMQPMIFYHEITQAKKNLKNRHSRQHLGSKLPYMAISFCPF